MKACRAKTLKVVRFTTAWLRSGPPIDRSVTGLARRQRSTPIVGRAEQYHRLAWRSALLTGDQVELRGDTYCTIVLIATTLIEK